MRYQITGKQIDIGEALQTHVQTELGSMFDKYAGRPTDANVIFPKAGMNMSAKRSCTFPPV